MLIGMHATASLDLEGLAAVFRAIEGNAEYIDKLFIGWIDPDLREVHWPRVEAVEPGPTLAPVGGFVDAAGLITLGPLLILNVFALAAQIAPIGTRRVALGRPAANALYAAGDQWNGHVQFLLTAGDGEL